MPKPFGMKWAVLWPHTSDSWHIEEFPSEQEARAAYRERKKLAPMARLVQMYVERR